MIDDRSGVLPRRTGLVTRTGALSGANALVRRQAKAVHGGIPVDVDKRGYFADVARLDVTRVGVINRPREQSPTTRCP
jgi:hypothetical protein